MSTQKHESVAAKTYDEKPVWQAPAGDFRAWFDAAVPEHLKVAISNGDVAPHIIMALLERAFDRLNPADPLPGEPLVPGTEAVPGDPSTHVAAHDPHHPGTQHKA